MWFFFNPKRTPLQVASQRFTLKAEILAVFAHLFGSKKRANQVIMTKIPTIYNFLFQLLKVGVVRLSEVGKWTFRLRAYL